MTHLGTLTIAIVLAAVVFAFTHYFSDEQRRLRELKSVSPTRIAEATHGEIVKIVGRVHPGEDALLGPLSGRSCAHWSVRISEASQRSVRTILDRSDSVDFVVEDETGKAWVRVGARFQVVVQRDHHTESGAFVPPGEVERRLLAGAGISPTTELGFNRALSFEEGVLAPGELVSVLGVAQWEDAPSDEPTSSAHYRETARRKRLVIVPRSNGVMIATDHRLA
jgi:hypothetical protein